jgi:hypothetical protein
MIFPVYLTFKQLVSSAMYKELKHNGIGLPIAEEPSHTTVRTDRVYGGSADQEA